MFKTYNYKDIKVGDICTRDDIKCAAWLIVAMEGDEVAIQHGYTPGRPVTKYELESWRYKNISTVGWVVTNRNKILNTPED